MNEMTAQQRNICLVLAQKYPLSAASSGGGAMRLRVRASFPKLETSSPDVKESFLEAAETLEREHIISLVWEKYRKGDEIKTIILENPQLLYKKLLLPFPQHEAETARAEALHAAEQALHRNNPASSRTHDFFLWLSSHISAADFPYSTADTSSAADFIKDTARLLETLEQYAAGGMLTAITLRSLSIHLFSDSKHIEKIISHIQPFLRRAENAGIKPPDISAVIRSYPDTMTAGSVVFTMDDGSEIVNKGASVLGIPYITARRIASVSTDSVYGEKILTIENKESFFALSSSPAAPYALFIYTGGHPNSAVQALLKACAQSGFSFTHAGDLDPDGILIMQEIAGIVQADVQPLKMDGAAFDKYFQHTRLLDSSSLERVSMIRDSTRQLPGIENLLTRILETGRALEQEIISYF